MPPADPQSPPSGPPPDLITLFIVPLNRLGLRYMVTGAVAAIVYGEPRLTNDVDLVIDLSPSDVAQLIRAFDPTEFYVPPAETIEEEVGRPQHGHFNLIHHATSLKADAYVAGQDRLHAWALEHRRRITVRGQDVWVAPPEYVILRKLEYFRDGGSDRHIRDIRAMLRELGDAIDLTTLEAEVRRLGVTAQWAKVSAR